MKTIEYITILALLTILAFGIWTENRETRDLILNTCQNVDKTN